MLGRTHALSGAAVFTGLDAGLLHLGPVPLLTGAVLTAGAAVLPDLDHPDATVSRTFGFLTQALAWAVGKASGGHRHGTHSATGAAVATGLAMLARVFAHTTAGLAVLALLAALLLAAALRALRLGGHSGDLAAIAAAAAMAWTGAGLRLLPWAVALGTATHIAGDMLTTEGCPLAWPLTARHYWLLPGPLRFETGHLAERCAVFPALLATLACAAVLALHGLRPPLCLRPGRDGLAAGRCSLIQTQPSQPPRPHTARRPQ
ncbi:MAG TPA: metal-dependent hydrolase [Streptosporangiaceae bacterium]|jgi:membrane-bound metal-dependent hydrolase YbcI (DUF457 family)